MEGLQQENKKLKKSYIDLQTLSKKNKELTREIEHMKSRNLFNEKALINKNEELISEIEKLKSAS
jgi:hypothetical protein